MRQNENCRTNKGSGLNGPSPSHLESHERGGDSKAKKGGLYEAEVVLNDLSAHLHGEPG